MELADLIRDVPDFPKPGITFKDITPLLADPSALAQIIAELAAPWSGKGVTKVVGIEARGFILAPAVALEIGAGFVPARKPGKLPWTAIRQSYGLEYGTDAIEMHIDAVRPGDRVLIIDDVLATGGTAGAAQTLVKRQGATLVGCAFLVELGFLNGRSKIEVPVSSVLRY
ncbi:MAG TPA: adenine phosphoribosyltransferase [Planctomycetes bacterium]|nr:adenine phosphoribosyltransferase [Planctomycetota bacterium]